MCVCVCVCVCVCLSPEPAHVAGSLQTPILSVQHSDEAENGKKACNWSRQSERIKHTFSFLRSTSWQRQLRGRFFVRFSTRIIEALGGVKASRLT